MSNYQYGKIYIIKSPNLDTPYIGSTTKSLNERFNLHKHQYNKCKSKHLIQAGDCYIELIENYPCETRLELEKREEEVKLLMKNQGINFINKYRSGINYRNLNSEERHTYDNDLYNERYKEKKRIYYIDNNERIKAYNKEYYIRKKNTSTIQHNVITSDDESNERINELINFMDRQPNIRVEMLV